MDSNIEREVSLKDEHGNEKGFLSWYLYKMKGPCKKCPERSSLIDICYTSLFGFISILLISVTGYWYLGKEFTVENGTAMIFVVGAYAATAVLVYDSELVAAPISQPRNVFGGYVVSSFIGIVSRVICGFIGLERWTTGAFATAFALIFMSLTKTLHPPAGAVALFAVIGGPGIWDLGFAYVLTSAGGAFIVHCVALLGNNLIPTRQYPVYWW